MHFRDAAGSLVWLYHPLGDDDDDKGCSGTADVVCWSVTGRQEDGVMCRVDTSSTAPIDRPVQTDWRRPVTPADQSHPDNPVRPSVRQLTVHHSRLLNPLRRRVPFRSSRPRPSISPVPTVTSQTVAAVLALQRQSAEPSQAELNWPSIGRVTARIVGHARRPVKSLNPRAASAHSCTGIDFNLGIDNTKALYMYTAYTVTGWLPLVDDEVPHPSAQSAEDFIPYPLFSLK